MAEDTRKAIIEVELDANEALNKIVQLNDEIDNSTEAQRRLQDAMKESGADSTALAKELEAQRQKTIALKKEKQTLTRQVQNDIKTQTQYNDSLKAMRARLSMLTDQFDSLGEAERKAAMESGGIGDEINELTTKIKQAEEETQRFFRNVGNYELSVKQALKNTTVELIGLTAKYRALSAEERNSAKGREMAQKIKQLTDEAGALKDTLGDTAAAIKRAASDTRSLDTIAEAGKLAAAGFGLATSAAQAFGKSEEDLQAVMLKVQQAMQAVQALQVVQNALQKESNVMRAVAIVQEKARNAALVMSTKSTVAATVAQKAFNIVANANPYVLLATAIISVAGAFVLLSSALSDNTTEAERNQKRMDELTKTAGEAAAQEQAHAKILYDSAVKAADGTKERIEAVKALQAQYPAYFGKMDAEHAKVSDLRTQYQLLSQDILQSAMARAAEDKLVEAFKKRFDIIDRFRKRKRMGEQAGDSEAAQAGLKAAEKLGAIDSVEDLAEEWGENKEEIAFYSSFAGSVKNVDVKRKPTATKTAKTAKTAKSGEKVDKEAEARKKLAEQLAAEAKKAQDEALKKSMEQGAQQINDYYDAQEKDIRAKYAGLKEMSEQESENLNTLIDANTQARNEALAKYNADQLAKYKEQQEKAQAEALELVNKQLDAVESGSLEEMALRMAQLDLQFDMERQKYQNNAEMLEAINKAHVAKQLEIEREYAEKSKQTEQERVQAIGNIMGTMSQIAGKFANESKAAAVASKMLALGQVAVEQGLAIAKGISSAMSVPFPANLPAIATTIAAIMSGITQALSAINSAKFATGGYVSGPGTATSDSIPARLSNGESVINANSTSMFGGLLSSLNMLGGGAPIQASASSQNVQGEQLLARAFAQGAAALPAPVVGVREFTKVNDRVTTIKEMARL